MKIIMNVVGICTINHRFRIYFLEKKKETNMERLWNSQVWCQEIFFIFNEASDASRKTFFYCRRTALRHENRLRTFTLIVNSINFSYSAGRKVSLVSCPLNQQSWIAMTRERRPQSASSARVPLLREITLSLKLQSYRATKAVRVLLAKLYRFL